MTDYDPELREAVEELHEYLADQRPPLMFADSMSVLLRQPPDLLASQVVAWLGTIQVSGLVSDYLYHAVRKVHAMGDYDLVHDGALKNHVKFLAEAVPSCCPEPEQDPLRQALARLLLAPRKSVTMRHEGAGRRRLSLLIRHLRPLLSGAAPEAERNEATSQFVAAAAQEAKTSKELDENLMPLKELGLETDTDKLILALARGLAGWAVPRMPGSGKRTSVTPRQITAMDRIVTLAEDPAETGKRFREIVQVACTLFADGEIGRAATMFELADRMVEEKKVSPHFVDSIRARGHERLDRDRLLRFAERADTRASLRTVIQFFETLRPAGLLRSLHNESLERKERRLLLALLETHGAEARAAAWERFQESLAGPRPEPEYQADLIHLLRVIPRPDDAALLEEEVKLVTRSGARDCPPVVLKQVLAFLGDARTEKAERTLASHLKSFETQLLQPQASRLDGKELESLLARTCSALARHGSSGAWKLLLDHGLRADPKLGNTTARLAEACRMDLSSVPEVLVTLLEALRSEMPRSGLMGLLSRSNEDRITSLVQAIEGSPRLEVQQVLEEVVARFQGRRPGAAAARALGAFAAIKPGSVAGSVSGELELFGLPNLLQSFARPEVTGVLTLLDREGTPQATVLVEEGRFRGCQHGSLLGPDALFQLLERPFLATFAFVPRTDVARLPGASEPGDLFPLLSEGIRRHDEFKLAAAIVSDAAVLKSTSNRHTLPPGEDPDFADHVWAEAVGGRPVTEIRSEVGSDSYRVRRLLAHWAEEGALRDVQEGPAA